MAKAEQAMRREETRRPPQAQPLGRGRMLAELLNLNEAALERLGQKAAMGGRIGGMAISDGVSLVRALVVQYGRNLNQDDLLPLPGGAR